MVTNLKIKINYVYSESSMLVLMRYTCLNKFGFWVSTDFKSSKLTIHGFEQTTLIQNNFFTLFKKSKDSYVCV